MLREMLKAGDNISRNVHFVGEFMMGIQYTKKGEPDTMDVGQATTIEVPQQTTNRLSDVLDAQTMARKAIDGKPVFQRLSELEAERVLIAREIARFMTRVERIETTLGIEVPEDLK